MLGLVLAGGHGSRLRPLTRSVLKQLLPIGNKPIITYGIDQLISAGIEDIGIVCQEDKREAIDKVLELYYGFKLGSWAKARFTYLFQEEPLGLAHAVLISQKFLGDELFIMYLGDNLLLSPINEFVSKFRGADATASILLKEVANPEVFGVATLDENGSLIDLEEKPKLPKSNLALVGVYAFSSKIFDAVYAIQPSKRGELEITDAIKLLLQQGFPIQYGKLEGEWLDTGKKDDLLSANRIVLDQYCVRNDLNSRFGTGILGRVEVGKGCRIEGSRILGPVRIADRTELIDCNIGPYTSIGSDCVIASASISESLIMDGSQILGVDKMISRSVIGENCVVKGNDDQFINLTLGSDSVVEVC